MLKRTLTRLTATSLLGLQLFAGPALAENQMGYSLLPSAEAAQLSRGGGTLGINVGRAQQITDGGMTFELLKVNSVRRGSAGEQAGIKTGDQVIAVDGRVFPSVTAFASYVGSKPAGGQLSVDYLPLGGGPKEAQRTSVTLGGAQTAAAPAAPAAPAGLSTGTKIAIGAGAAALFGCYELGCFSHGKTRPNQGQRQPGTMLQR